MSTDFPTEPEAIERFARRIVRFRRAAQFRSFWLGAQLAARPNSSDTPEQLQARRAFNRNVGLRVLELAPGLEATPVEPEASFTLRLPSGEVAVSLAPLLVYGRYLKFSRNLPQSKWPCRRHGGPNCPKCGGTGRLYPSSVEEMVAEDIMAQTGGKGTKLHAVGREDVDARMVGTGRPFVLEVARPLRRNPDLALAERRIAEKHGEDVLARGLRVVDKADLDALNAAQPDKSYRALCRASDPLPPRVLEALDGLEDVLLEQRTPERVLHRRPDIIRGRRLRKVKAAPADAPDRFVLEIAAQSGTYIKEFISGDKGRTRPSASGILGVRCKCLELDVVDVGWGLNEGS